MTFTADIPQFPEFSCEDTRKVMRDNALELLGVQRTALRLAMGEWTIGAVLDAIADAVPDRLMTVCGTRRSTFGESAERTRRLANFLAGHGFGAHLSAADLAELGMRTGPRCPHHAQRSLSRHGDRLVSRPEPSLPTSTTTTRPARWPNCWSTCGRGPSSTTARSGPSSPTCFRPAGARPVDRGGRRQPLYRCCRERSTLEDALAQGDTDQEIFAVTRRRDDGVHRRDHGTTQGRDVAAERHLRGVHERCRS